MARSIEELGLEILLCEGDYFLSEVFFNIETYFTESGCLLCDEANIRLLQNIIAV